MPKLSWTVTEKGSRHVAIDIFSMIRRLTTYYVLKKGAEDIPLPKATRNVPLRGHGHH